MPFNPASITNEYKKDTNLRRVDVEAIFEWLKKQPHLPELTELQIVLFLHSCYYSVEAAKTAIDNYFTVKTLCSDIFKCPSEDVLKQTLSVGFISILPKQTPQGFLIFTMKLIDCKPKNYDCVNFLKLMNMVAMLHLHQNGCASGVVVIFDMQGSSLGHLTKVNLTAMKQFMYHVQEGLPVRIKGFHVVNVVFFADKLMNMLKPFMKKELAELVTFHPDSFETLHKHIPKECLPEDYGGGLPSIKSLTEINTKHVLENLEFFHWHDDQTVDETRRYGKPKDVNTMFGIEGTFKRLEID